MVAIAKAIHDGVGDVVHELYRACLLNTPLRIEIYDNAQDRLWRAHQLRQGEAQTGSVAKPTPIQTIMYIVEAKQLPDQWRNKSLGAEQCAVKRNEQLKLASGSDAIMGLGGSNSSQFTGNQAMERAGHVTMHNLVRFLITHYATAARAFNSADHMNVLNQQTRSYQSVRY